MSLKDLLSSRLSKPASRVLDAPIRDAIHEILREAGYASPAELQTLRDELRDLRNQLAKVEQRANDLASQLQAARNDADPRVATLSDTLSSLQNSLHTRLSAIEASIATPVAAPPPAPDDGRLSTLEAQVAAFPGIVEQRLSTLEARIAILPASLENRMEDLEAKVSTLPASLENRMEDLEAKVSTLPASLENRMEDLEAKLHTEIPAPLPPAETPAPEHKEEPAPLTAGPRPDCKVDGCDRPNRSKGFCSSHYQQWRRGTLKGFLSPEGTALVDGHVVMVGMDQLAAAYHVEDGKLYVEGVLFNT